jgi:hypothetical protein
VRRQAAVVLGFVVCGLVALGVPVRADAKPKAPAPPLTPDEQTVAAALVRDAFPRPSGAPLVLCLDVQVTDAAPDEGAPGEELPQPPTRGRARRGAKRARPATPSVPPAPVVRGAPRAIVDELNRPWRTVVSATACRLDPLQPYALKDAQHTPAQLVTVRLAPGPTPATRQTSMTARIDWSSAPETGHSRDCTTAYDGHGWTVHCGGTWAQ